MRVVERRQAVATLRMPAILVAEAASCMWPCAQILRWPHQGAGGIMNRYCGPNRGKIGRTIRDRT